MEETKGNVCIEESQFERDLKASGEYEDLMLTIGGLETYREIEKKILALCEYAYSMGEAQGHYDATGVWKT